MRRAVTTELGDPFQSRYISVNQVRLHYVEHGHGSPVVFLHGNGSMVSDFLSSQVVPRLVCKHRVIAFDRPGFGFSERPRQQSWGPFEQARLFLRAFDALNIERPILVGHSWGTLVALAAAIEAGRDIAGLVLLSGYYYPEPWREESNSNALARMAFPFAEEILRETVVPLLNRMLAPRAVSKVFAPCPVPERFMQEYSISHAVRPSQMRAVVEEADMLIESARKLSELYQELHLPVRLVAGSADRVVPTHKHSARLHQEIASSDFRNIDGVGHMVHHSAPDHVVAAVEAIAEAGSKASCASASRSRQPRTDRRWLHIGEAQDRQGKPVR